MKLFPLLFFIILAGCSEGVNSSAKGDGRRLSRGQFYLTQLKDSLMSDYTSAKSQKEKQRVLDKYHQRLEDYLLHHSMDSIHVTIDEVSVGGKTIRIKSHQSGIQFEYGLTFNGKMSPRIDSIFEFMKGLKEGTDTLVNFSFAGACQVNSPDSPNLSPLRIYAFPVPLQYTRM